MSFLKVIFNRKATNRLIFAGAFLLGALSIGYLFGYFNNPEKHYQEFKSKVKYYKDIIDEYLITLSQRNQSELYEIIEDKTLKKNSVTLLIYEDGFLNFWSDNNVPVNVSYDQNNFEDGYIFLSNGLYQCRIIDSGNRIYVGLLLIKNTHGYENEYIKNEINSIFNLPEGTKLGTNSNGLDIYNQSGKFIFSFEFDPDRKINDPLSLIIALSFLIGFIFIISALFQMYRGLNTILNRPKLLFFFFVLDAIILRAIQFYISFPKVLYESKLFGPSYLAISPIIPSLGDLFISSVLLLTLSWYFYKYFNFNLRTNLPLYGRIFAGFSLVLHVHIFFYFFQEIFEKIVFDSIISLNLGNIFSLSWQSLLGFLSISALLLSFVLISIKLCFTARNLFQDLQNYFAIAILATIVTGLLYYLRGESDWPALIFVLLFIFSFGIGTKTLQKTFSFPRVILLLVGISIFMSYSLQKLNNAKEEQQRMLVAIELATNRDKITEFRFKELADTISSDAELIGKAIEAFHDPEYERAFEDFVLQKYFDKFWAKYDILVTLCYPGKELKIKPGDFIINCSNYFEGYIQSLGEPTDCKNLFHLLPGINYLARLEIENDDIPDDISLTLYIEMNSKAVSKGLGYPELLIEGVSPKSSEMYGYSYAMYLNGELVRSMGRYSYTLTDSSYPVSNQLFSFFEQNQYKHLLYNAGPGTKLIVSLPKPGFLDIVAPFSYLVIFFSFFVFLFVIITGGSFSRPFYVKSFRNRIQYSIFGIVLISFITIGISSLYYISRLNQNKNISVLNEKNHSVLIELEHKLSDHDELGEDTRDYLETLLAKFSMVFFSDINVYDPQGILLASSRPQIFEEGLISNRMNAMAYKQLAIEGKSSFIHDETIGKYKYLSAYLPFLNDQNKLIGFVNLPYFARQSELRQEISTFLIAFTNIYVVLMAFGLSLSLLLSDYLLRPLMLLKTNLKRVKLSESTQKIEWKGEDEISELIDEYNRMTEELVKSAELLARSERESAWREMAKQVAHEIKNPLTPMKLSVQYLQKAWNDKAEDWDERLGRFTQTLTQQIDSLSEIASAFSDFASMPAATHEKVNLAEIIESAVGLFKEIENIKIKTSTQESSEMIVYADSRQLLRVFNNLIQNSVQAIGSSPDGLIQINIDSDNNYYQVSVSDNGSGITPDQQARIFSPYFTTKTSGMGLGLAIVRNIISGIGGQISFTSEPNKGTTFIIRIPKAID